MEEGRSEGWVGRVGSIEEHRRGGYATLFLMSTDK